MDDHLYNFAEHPAAGPLATAANGQTVTSDALAWARKYTADGILPDDYLGALSSIGRLGELGATNRALAEARRYFDALVAADALRPFSSDRPAALARHVPRSY